MTTNCPHCLQKLPNANQFGPLKAFPEAGVVILGSEQYKLSLTQTKLMELFIDKFNLPVPLDDLYKHLYGEEGTRSPQAVWAHIGILTKRIANTGYRIEHVCSSTWRLRKDDSQPSP